LVSKSKIPPQFCRAVRQILKVGGDGVDAFGFHGDAISKSREYTAGN